MPVGHQGELMVSPLVAMMKLLWQSCSTGRRATPNTVEPIPADFESRAFHGGDALSHRGDSSRQPPNFAVPFP